MSDRPQLQLNGKTYDFVRLDEFTIDEGIVLWEYAHLGMNQLPDMEGFHPGVVAALIHVAVARVETGLTFKDLRRTIGSLPMVELEQVFENISVEVDDESVPPPSAPGSESVPEGTSASSGEGSSPTGESPEGSGANGSGEPGSAITAISGPVT